MLTDFSRGTDNISGQENQLVLLSPHPNTTYRIDPNFDHSSQQLHIEAAVGQGISQVTIRVDDTY